MIKISFPLSSAQNYINIEHNKCLGEKYRRNCIKVQTFEAQWKPNYVKVSYFFILVSFQNIFSEGTPLVRSTWRCHHLRSIFSLHNPEFWIDFRKKLILPWISFFNDLDHREVQYLRDGTDSILRRFALITWRLNINDEKNKFTPCIKLVLSGY